MANQLAEDVVIAYKLEATYNTAPGAAGAKQLRLFASPGLGLDRQLIENNEIRSDGLSSMGRLGSRSAPGSYSGPLAVGAYDEILEAVLRSTWVAAVPITVDGTAPNVSFTVDNSSQFTYIGTTTLHTKGLRVGDVVRFTNMSNAANNGKNVRIKTIDVAGLVVTVHGTPLTAQAADSAATLTIQRKIKNAATPTRRTFYVEQYGRTIDLSEVFGGCKWIGFKITGTPDGLATIEIKILVYSLEVLAVGTSPYYSSPTLSTADALTFVDAVIAYNGVDVANATAFELSYMTAAGTEPVIGSTVSPDVFDNRSKLTGSLSFIRQDLLNVTKYLNETEVELHVMLVENDAEPKDFISLFVPRVKLLKPTAPIGGDKAMVEVIPWTSGKKEGFSSTGYDDTLMTLSTSAV